MGGDVSHPSALRIHKAELDRIRAHAATAYPEEGCGFLIGRHEGRERAVLEARPTANVHPGPRSERYRIDPAETFRVEREFRAGERRIVGFYHSHPDHPARPSPFDLEGAWPYYVYAIVSIPSGTPGEVTAWSLDDARHAFVPVPLVPT